MIHTFHQLSNLYARIHFRVIAAFFGAVVLWAVGAS